MYPLQDLKKREAILDILIHISCQRGLRALGRFLSRPMEDENATAMLLLSNELKKIDATPFELAQQSVEIQITSPWQRDSEFQQLLHNYLSTLATWDWQRARPLIQSVMKEKPNFDSGKLLWKICRKKKGDVGIALDIVQMFQERVISDTVARYLIIELDVPQKATLSPFQVLIDHWKVRPRQLKKSDLDFLDKFDEASVVAFLTEYHEFERTDSDRWLAERNKKRRRKQVLQKLAYSIPGAVLLGLGIGQFALRNDNHPVARQTFMTINSSLTGIAAGALVGLPVALLFAIDEGGYGLVALLYICMSVGAVVGGIVGGILGYQYHEVDPFYNSITTSMGAFSIAAFTYVWVF